MPSVIHSAYERPEFVDGPELRALLLNFRQQSTVRLLPDQNSRTGFLSSRRPSAACGCGLLGSSGLPVCTGCPIGARDAFSHLQGSRTRHWPVHLQMRWIVACHRLFCPYDIIIICFVIVCDSKLNRHGIESAGNRFPITNPGLAHTAASPNGRFPCIMAMQTRWGSGLPQPVPPAVRSGHG